MSFSFPASPTVGQQSTQNGRVYSWTGSAWELAASVASHTHTEQMLFVHDIASTIDQNSSNTLVYSVVENDPYTAYDSTTGTFTVPVGKSGVYAIQACMIVDGGTALESQANFGINGSSAGQVILNITTAANTDGTIRLNAFGLVQLNAGETVNFIAFVTASSGDGWYPNNDVSTFNYVMLYKL